MAKRSNKNGAKTGRNAGGIGSALTQDVELTVEEVEETAKKVVRAAASALSIATGEVSDEVLALSKKSSAPAKSGGSRRASKRKPNG